jgi:serine/threonine-protein kinase
VDYRKLCTRTALAISVFAWSGRAVADEASQKAAAEAVFEEGRDLVAQKKYVEACPKFELSQKLDPGVGTLLYLADCYEKSGRYASAWATFLEAAAAAKTAGQSDREALARDLAAALRPKLSKLTITVDSGNQGAGVVVKRDGQLVEQGLWGIPVPVDAGRRTIEATAQGKQRWSTSIDIEGPSTSTVNIPVLVDDPNAAVAPVAAPQQAAPAPASAAAPAAATSPNPERDEAPSDGSTQRVLGYVLGGLGIVGLGVGGVFSLQAISKNGQASDHCDSTGCDQKGVDLGDEAHSAATLATVATGAGLVLLGGGVVLVLTAPSGPSSATGVTLQGVF